MRILRVLGITTCLLKGIMGFSVPPYSPRSNSRSFTPHVRNQRSRTPLKRTPKVTPSSTAMFGTKGFELADLFYDDTSMAFDAWYGMMEQHCTLRNHFLEWTANIGAPAALVAGAVLATLSETREESAPRKSDSLWVRRGKVIMRFLLMSSFALEVVSIFVSTMTGSVLLGHGPAKKAVGYLAPLQLLHYHHEYVCFSETMSP
eukprot:scaffold2261_cov124-Cylindrotheca_fusiformis.AAC.11